MHRAWRLAPCAVLLVAGAVPCCEADVAGFVAGGAWLALLVAPAIGLRKIAEFASAQRYAQARRLARALLFLHPRCALRAQAEVLCALELGNAEILPGACPAGAVAEQPTRTRPAGGRGSFRCGVSGQSRGWARSELRP